MSTAASEDVGRVPVTATADRPLAVAERRSALAAERLLLLRGADTIHHGRWSLFEHLRGTAALLHHWKQPEFVCRAGLFHSVYSTDAFGTALFAWDEADDVVSVIGAEAERLVHLFGSLDRTALFTTWCARHSSAAEVTLRDRRNGRDVRIASDVAATLVVLHLANTGEQACRDDGSPAPWLARMSAPACGAAAWLIAVPPLFDDCTARVSEADEHELLSAYAAATRDGEPSMERLDAAVDAVPHVAEPAIVTAMMRLTRGDVAGARSRARAALARLNVAGFPWDKRLSLAAWRELATFVLHAADRPVAQRDFDAARLKRLLEATGGMPAVLHARLASVNALASADDQLPCRPIAFVADSGARPVRAAALPERFERYVRQLTRAADPEAYRTYPQLPSVPWHDPAQFSIVRKLERMAPLICEELHELDPRSFHAEGEPIERTGSWDVYMLFERGRRRDDNCAAFPITTRIVEAFRTVKTLAGMCYFSRLSPHTRVAPHRGPTNMRLRCHLGIDVPPGCGVLVGGVAREWSEGRCIVFDDSFEHSVWNDSALPRVVLIVDLWHPGLSEEEVTLLEGVQGYAGACAHELNRYWGMNESARRASGAD